MHLVMSHNGFKLHYCYALELFGPAMASSVNVMPPCTQQHLISDTDSVHALDWHMHVQKLVLPAMHGLMIRARRQPDVALCTALLIMLWYTWLAACLSCSAHPHLIVAARWTHPLEPPQRMLRAPACSLA